MDFTHFSAGTDDSERRLDKILRRFLSEEGLSSLYKSLRKGLIKVNGKKCDGSLRIKTGDDIQIASFLLQNKSNEKITPTSPSDSVSAFLETITVFKNESILILNKPYDIPVQPSASSKGKSLADLVQAEYESTHEKTSLSFRTGPLHRLDRKTTGLIVFSQNAEGARWFSENIKNHLIQKSYLAVLEGNLTKKEVWEDYIEKSGSGKEQSARSTSSENFHTVTVNSNEKSGKAAHTEVHPVSHGIYLGREITLAKILIKSGRTHQIRSQSAYHGYPLLGDTAYGGEKIESKKFGQDFFLHAHKLHFPAENSLSLPQEVTAHLPASFRDFLENSAFPHYN